MTLPFSAYFSKAHHPFRTSQTSLCLLPLHLLHLCFAGKSGNLHVILLPIGKLKQDQPRRGHEKKMCLAVAHPRDQLPRGHTTELLPELLQLSAAPVRHNLQGSTAIREQAQGQPDASASSSLSNLACLQPHGTKSPC